MPAKDRNRQDAMTPQRKRRASSKKAPPFSALVLDWYDRNARQLPWRVRPGDKADPYAVWLSEIMLQQTVVAAVKPYFEKFLETWPRVNDLAAADRDDVLAAWAGLGYYSRARNLHACANAVVADYGGEFPDQEDELCRLPGIGPYTAAAIAAIAFGRRANAVDGNIERVVARYCAISDPLPKSKSQLKTAAEELLPAKRCGDYIQGLMDLGATVCTPKSPKCLLCPLSQGCEARRLGIATELPVKSPKAAKPTRRGAAFYVQRSDGAILLRRRADQGLLGGMLEVPSSPWEPGVARNDVLEHVPFDADWIKQPGLVRHTFTHFHLELKVFTALACDSDGSDGEWASRDGLESQALPTVMRKVIRHAIVALADQA